MDWKDVGEWLKDNAGAGAALVGSLVTGNVPAAVAAGVSMISSATGESKPDLAAAALQNNPATLLRLRELALQDEQNIREHIRQMTEAQLKDAQAEQEQTQLTIRSGDNSADPVVRRTRPFQSWLSLVAGIGYVFYERSPNVDIIMILFTLPWTYAGLRQIGKAVDMFGAIKSIKR